ncbi:SCO family protein [Paenibacillus thailandensis]|uniref:SCO family protein n=1 Tax=Paenibacillus thailandensis TaxID=393250 RepID=A0ABW5QS22_9BACL
MAFVRKHGFKLAVLALCLSFGLYLWFAKWSAEGETLPVIQAAPSFALTDIDGNEVSLESTNGKARIVYFYFANCPDVCPPTTFLLSQVQELLKKDGTLGKEAEIISITFDPERDTPEAIRAFAERNFADLSGGWLFLRGDDEEQSLQLAKSFGVGVIKDEATGNYGHSNIITLVDKQGQIRKYINGSEESLTAEQIAEELKKLM